MEPIMTLDAKKSAAYRRLEELLNDRFVGFADTVTSIQPFVQNEGSTASVVLNGDENNPMVVLIDSYGPPKSVFDDDILTQIADNWPHRGST
jgi:hypothetical protein